jgi:uncharacterized surface protein with fasciclin (FAS1) repeats
MSRHILFLAVVALFALTFAAAPAVEAAPPGPTVVDVALQVNADTGEFDTLIAALLAADPAVIGKLGSNGQRTVFAPTDAAFAAIGLDETNIGTVPQDALTNILLYHVANGRRDATDVTSSTQIRMLNGQFTQISLNGGAYINNAEIVITDVFAANGVIHVIDAVLLP